jgi:hypothetical protein
MTGVNQGAFLMKDESRIANDLESLKRRIRDGKRSLEEAAKKTENFDASIRAEIRARQSANNKKKSK